MAKKLLTETELTPVQANAAALAAHFEGAEMPGWVDPAKHRLGEFGFYDIASGMLLDGDGLPQSAAARAGLHDQLVAELAAELAAEQAAELAIAAPAADAALAAPEDPQA